MSHFTFVSFFPKSIFQKFYQKQIILRAKNCYGYEWWTGLLLPRTTHVVPTSFELKKN